MDIAIEGQGSSVRPHGVTPDSLAPGDRVTAVVNPSRRDSDTALGRLIIKEDGTVDVETSHFSENNAGNNFRVPSGPQKHLVERLALSDDGSHLTYGYVMEDPDYIEAPVTGATRWNYRPDLTPDDVPCDLESAGRYLNE